MSDTRDALTGGVIGMAIEVHRALGPGLLESVYEECLCFELRNHGISFERQAWLPITYKGILLDAGYRMDLGIERALIVELKTVERLMPIHEAQLLTYLKLSGLTIGLLLDFQTATLKEGIKRLVL
jgi:GxxExxY protein